DEGIMVESHRAWHSSVLQLAQQTRAMQVRNIFLDGTRVCITAAPVLKQLAGGAKPPPHIGRQSRDVG
ncbi:MAG: hypothetical protein M3Q91_18710, partial [Acidobacteriota bacterium]|nr:hypothetical protein [Acidobacteriota bacterium]